MENKAIAVFTAKSVETCLEVGGTQSWALNPASVKDCGYAVLCRNLHTSWGDGREPHRTAFMIGHISGVVPSRETAGRWLITFDEYAVIDKPGVWEKWRNPIHYTTLKALGITLEKIQFQPMPEITKKSRPESVSNEISAKKMDISTAKRALASYYGLSPEAIEITIRG